MSKNTSRETNNNYQEIGQIHQLGKASDIIMVKTVFKRKWNNYEL